MDLDGDSEIELGWHTKKASWDQGVATEAATPMVRLAFEGLGIRRLVAVIHPDHLASRRVAEKIGMHEERTTVIDDYPCLIYAIEALAVTEEHGSRGESR